MAEDWLPHEPPPQPPAPSSARRTLVVWAVLVVMFLVIYTMLSRTEPTGATARSGYSGWWIVVAGVVGIVVSLVYISFRFSGFEKLHAALGEGLDASARGDFARAAELYAARAATTRGKPEQTALALYSCGYALLRAGRSEEAVGALLGAERLPTLATVGIRRIVATELVRAFVIGGDLDKASRWLDSVRARPLSGDRVHQQTLEDAAAGLLLCRQGKFEDALALYERRWRFLEAYLPVRQMEEAWLLRAFALTMTSGPRAAGVAEPWLRMIRGLPPGAFDWLTERWPELATFVTSGNACGAMVGT